MHQNLVKFENYEISWLEGSQCLLAIVRESMQGFRGVSTFFSALREARSTMKANDWVLDLRDCRKVPEELWNWVESSWYPQIVSEGLLRQAIVLPKDGGARSQWTHLEPSGLKQRHFKGLPLAIHWLGEDIEYARPMGTGQSPAAAFASA